MTPIELNQLYQELRTRVSSHLPRSSGCAEISVKLPANFCNELAFYQLVIWSYVLIIEAARIPLQFLIRLPPLKREDNPLQKEVSCLRTYLTHNLDKKNRKDMRTYAIVHRWLMEACGHGTPNSDTHYAVCCAYLVDRVQEMLNGAIEACDLFDHPEDGPRLIADLKRRLSA